MSSEVLFAPSPPVYVRYDQEIEAEIDHLGQIIAQMPDLYPAYNPRWLAIQLLEGDEHLLQMVNATRASDAVLQAVNSSLARLQAHYGEDVDVMLTDQRYRFVHSLVRSVQTCPDYPDETTSDKIDRIVTHRLLGIPIFLLLMWVVFKLTLDVAAPYVGWIDGVISGPLTFWSIGLLRLIGLGDTWFQSLLVDGIITGVGGVLVFVPVLMTLYMALALLEDSGYMARAAFVMDRLMHVLGLHGKSFLPMIVGFGCNVPAIYATRTLEHGKDRLLTGLLVPFMSCSARLPVYILLAAIFFPTYGGLVIFGVYLLGILMAIGLGVLFKYTLFSGKEQAAFIMELPPYRVPTFTGIWTHMWERTSEFVRKAWTIILAVSVVSWFLMAIPTGPDGSFADTPLPDSAFAAIARTAAPVFAPLGFGTWETSGALVSGIVAKEVVISTMAQIYGVASEPDAQSPSDNTGPGFIVTSFAAATLDTLRSIPLIVGIDLSGGEADTSDTGLNQAVRASFDQASGGHGSLAALAFMVFVLLYTPCMATAAAARHEFGPRWMWFSLAGQLALAWIAALLVFQGGVWLGL